MSGPPRYPEPSPFDDEPEDTAYLKPRAVDDMPVVIRRVSRPTAPSYDDDAPPPPDVPQPVRVAPRPTASDPTFGLLIAFALNLGLAALGPQYGDLRYLISWGTLAAFGVGAWLIGSSTRIQKERIENLAWGAAFGLMIGVPLLFVGGETLHTTVMLAFRTGSGDTVVTLSPASVLAFVVFVMPLGESLFFRGVLQPGRPFWLAGGVGAIWSILLIFPMIDVSRYPLIAVLIGSALALMNMTYSYVCQRNGLAAAWICQIVVNLLVFFVPFMMS